MSISLIRGCSTTSPLNRTSSRSNAPRSTGRRPPAPLQDLEDPGALHHPPRQRRVQRRQGQRAVPEQFDQWPARAEQEHRAELRIGAATEDELVAVELDHRLDGHAQEVLGADAPAYGLLDRAIGVAHRLGIGAG